MTTPMMLNPNELTVLFVLLAVLLVAAKAFGEVARHFNQPAMVGEILAGVLLGPTLLGALGLPWTKGLFPPEGRVALAFDVINAIGLTLFLLAAGMEVDLHSVRRKVRSVLFITISGLAFPFILGFVVPWYFPHFFGCRSQDARLLFALFTATAFSVSALPVIARTLMDLGLFRSDLGTLIIAPAVFIDVACWIIFAVIQGAMGVKAGAHPEISRLIVSTLAFAGLMLTAGRWMIHRLLSSLQAYPAANECSVSIALILAFLGGALSESIGLHAVFGSFIAGAALGDSSHLSKKTRDSVMQFISIFFLPLFFAGIGLKANFLADFNPLLVLVVCLVAFLGKMVGCSLGARASGLSWALSLSIGAGMNARGAMEIVLGLVALQSGLISSQLFVALVVMALLTSVMSGPLIRRLIAGQDVHQIES